MLSLPEKYKKNAPITKVTFVRRASLAGAEKKRFETSVEEIRLMYQIEGFDIPNLVNDDYNCQVIMFLRIRIKDLKQSAFISKIVQRCIAPLCVIEITDGTSVMYSFADKRLNKQNKEEIVIESDCMTDKMPLEYNSDIKTLFSLYIDYETILNRNNKHLYYVEMMTKSFLVFNQSIYTGSLKLLDSQLWYNDEKLMMCLPLLKKLKTLKQSAAKVKTVAERSTFNKQMKEIMKQLDSMCN